MFVMDLATLSPTAVVVPDNVHMSGYVIEREIGRGGMGVVYRARQTSLDRVVALKMILVGGHAAESDLARFRSEGEAIARLQHPNIVQIHEVGEQNGLPYFSLEFCGNSLDRELNGTPLVPLRAAQLVETLARAMQVAHDKGIIHRDLKLANVLLTDDGTPKITDFGLAKRLDEAGRTASGAVVGTPSYMSAEQAGGAAGRTGRSTGQDRGGSQNTGAVGIPAGGTATASRRVAGVYKQVGPGATGMAGQ